MASDPGSDDAEVVVVGYGPVGQVLSILLAQQGWRVTVLEKWPRLYPMPRAVSFDGESARILAAAGIADDIAEIGEFSRDYTWRNAAGETLLQIDVAQRGQCGWADSTSMYQPGLEAALAARGEALAGLRVLRGHSVVELIDGADQVEVGATDGRGGHYRTTAAFVVGCDGANSFIRERMGVELVDLDFSSDWLTCDVVPTSPRTFEPNNLQICDPARPTTVVSAGPTHRRWEFMRMPGETVAELNRPETAWRLLEPFDMTPDNAVLQRHTVYTFQARYADRWRSGRLLLAGDSAHLMPPFAGQGMCSGFRDAANLAWKLDLVLAGRAGDGLLDTYTAERRAHVQHAIGMSVNLGKVICQPNPSAAADRDMVMLATRRRNAGRPQQPAVYQALTAGFLQAGAKTAGRLIPQGRVARSGATGLFDDVVGRGFAFLFSDEPAEVLTDDARAGLRRHGVIVVRVLPAGTTPPDGNDVVVDLDDVYLPFLTQAGVIGVLVRPDSYVFGAGGSRDEIQDMVADLDRRLSADVVEIAAG